MGESTIQALKCIAGYSKTLTGAALDGVI